MSQAVPGSSGRLTPRWSAAGQNDGLAASLAGLFAAIAMVLVEPPLLASAPTSGLALMSKPQLVPCSMLCPWRVKLPDGSIVQLFELPPAVLPEMIEFRTVSGESST